MMLLNLEPQFLQIDGLGYQYVNTLEEAQGILFVCPLCAARAGSNAGVHYVLCWFRDKGVPDDVLPGPGRWLASGSSYADLTLSPSINLPGEGCGWHGWLQGGDAK